jgi:hypothetical protein
MEALVKFGVQHLLAMFTESRIKIHRGASGISGLEFDCNVTISHLRICNVIPSRTPPCPEVMIRRRHAVTKGASGGTAQDLL